MAQRVRARYTATLFKERDEEVIYTAVPTEEGSVEVTGLYLSTTRIPTQLGGQAIKLRGITFEVNMPSSPTWFEVSILRPLGATRAGNTEVALERVLTRTYPSPADSREDLVASGWDFEHHHDGKVSWLVCKYPDTSRQGRCTIRWGEGEAARSADPGLWGRGSGEGFMSFLKPGTVVVLWARADVSRPTIDATDHVLMMMM